MSAKQAIIMAAGTSARFVPNSLEYPKGLAVVKGEVLIERQIRQLKEACTSEIIVVTGYKSEQFQYLAEHGIHLIHNPDYDSRNNHSSLYYARNFLEDTYICSSDNYFCENPFLHKPSKSYYSAVFVEGETDEWVIHTDEENMITDVTIGGADAWVMLGHAYFNKDFGCKFRQILIEEFDKKETVSKYWENLFIEHVSELPMKIKKYADSVIFEFDSLDELREFDSSYWSEPKSEIISFISQTLNRSPKKLHSFEPLKEKNHAVGFKFHRGKKKYVYLLSDNHIMKKREYKQWKKSKKDNCPTSCP
jgi:CTP:phosphocholine cytidylyltransferase-like protein